MKKMALLMLSIVLLSCFSGCRTNEQLAVWPNRNISIDGKLADWSGYLALNEDSNVAFGFLRDSTYFYICLVTSDPDIQRQIMGKGLVVWLEADRNTKNRIGIKFPLGMMASGVPQQEFMRNRTEMDGEQPEPSFEHFLNEMEIQSPGEKTFNRYGVSEIAQSGLEVGAGLAMEQLVYEMKIPLIRGKNTPYALGIEPVQVVALEIEIPEIDREAMREKMMSMGGGRGRGERPPRGMLGGGPPGGRMHGGDTGWKQNKSLKVKFSVRLKPEK
jgi:hypothetical protein